MPAGAYVFSKRMIAGCISEAPRPKAARVSTSCSGVSRNTSGIWVSPAAAVVNTSTRAGSTRSSSRPHSTSETTLDTASATATAPTQNAPDPADEASAPCNCMTYTLRMVTLPEARIANTNESR